MFSLHGAIALHKVTFVLAYAAESEEPIQLLGTGDFSSRRISFPFSPLWGYRGVRASRSALHYPGPAMHKLVRPPPITAVRWLTAGLDETQYEVFGCYSLAG